MGGREREWEGAGVGGPEGAEQATGPSAGVLCVERDTRQGTRRCIEKARSIIAAGRRGRALPGQSAVECAEVRGGVGVVGDSGVVWRRACCACAGEQTRRQVPARVPVVGRHAAQSQYQMTIRYTRAFVCRMCVCVGGGGQVSVCVWRGGHDQPQGASRRVLHRKPGGSACQS